MITRAIVDSSTLENLLMSNAHISPEDVPLGKKSFRNELLFSLGWAGGFGLAGIGMYSLHDFSKGPFSLQVTAGTVVSLVGAMGGLFSPFLARDYIRFEGDAKNYLDSFAKGEIELDGHLDLYWVDSVKKIAVGDNRLTSHFGRKIHLVGSDTVSETTIGEGDLVACGFSHYAMVSDSPYHGTISASPRSERKDLSDDSLQIRTPIGVFDASSGKVTSFSKDSDYGLFTDSIIIGRKRGFMTREDGSWMPTRDSRFEVVGYFPLNAEPSLKYVG